MARINNIFDLNLVLNKIIPRGWVRVHLVYPQTHTSAQEAMVSTVLNAKASILMASDLIRTSPTPNQPPQVYPQTHTSAQEAMVSTVLNAKASILMASDLTRTSPTPNLLGNFQNSNTHTIYVVRQLAYSTELLVCINEAYKQYKQRRRR
jgi:hypothetical protein